MAAININRINKLTLKKISSFTIIELIITMMISSIIITFGYYSYFLLNNQFNKYHTNSTNINEYYLLSTTLQRDFDRANLIKDTIDNKHLILKSDSTVIYYLIVDSTIMRGLNGNIDTFRIRGDIADVQYVNDSLNLIKEITFNATLNNQLLPFSITKKYSSKELMQGEQLQHE